MIGALHELPQECQQAVDLGVSAVPFLEGEFARLIVYEAQALVLHVGLASHQTEELGYDLQGIDECPSRGEPAEQIARDRSMCVVALLIWPADDESPTICQEVGGIRVPVLALERSAEVDLLVSSLEVRVSVHNGAW